MLRGPLDDELDDMRQSYGFRPEIPRAAQERRAAQEVDQAARLDEQPRWRRGRIRDVVAARYVAIELLDMMNRGLDARGRTFDQLFKNDREAIRRFVDGMPSGDVHISLQVQAHRDGQSPWSVNDIFDIDALANAVPYCDVVVPDARRAHDLVASGCAERFGVDVYAKPEDLVEALS